MIPYEILVPIAIAVVVIALIVLIFTTGYLKAPPDKAYMISGLRTKTVIGKASIRIPFLERVDTLDLALFSIDVKTKSAVPTADFINVWVDGIATVKISTDEAMLALAAQNFLNRDREYIAGIVQEILEGNMREIVGKMALKDMVNNRQKFAEEVKEDVIPDLQKMGLELVNFNVQNFSDNQDVITNLGVDNISQISKNASIAKANAEAEVAEAQAEANRKKAKAQAEAQDAANAADVEARTSIAERENTLAIRKAKLQAEADSEQAVADAAGEIQRQRQLRTIREAEADAELGRQKKEVEVQEQSVIIRERQLEAETKKKADAELYRAQREAEADLFRRQKQAEAQRFEAQQQAEAAKIAADAAMYAAEQEAVGIRAKGEAEAAAILAKKEAEAQGVLKLAEAQQKMGEASIIEMYFKTLPEVARAVATPLGNVDSITMYGEGNTAKLTRDVTTSLKQVVQGVDDVTGGDIISTVKAGAKRLMGKADTGKKAE